MSDLKPDYRPVGYSRAVHGFALALTLSVFPLIWVGSLVTTYDAGMAVPDWPTTYGYNMFTYPLTTWLYGPFDLLAEHSHRLLGTVAGMLTIGLVLSAWKFDSRTWFKWWTLIVLLAVIGQGLLGGLRVRWDARTLAMVHGCTASLFFAMATSTAVMSSKFWFHADGRLWSTGSLARWTATLMALLSFAQLTVGAQLRHVTGGASPQFFAGSVHLHLTLAGAIVLLSFVLWSSTTQVAAPPTRRSALGLVLLVLVQVALGIGTWLVNYALPWPELNEFLARYTIQAKGYAESMVVTAHVATGSLIICFSTVATFAAWRTRAVRATRPEGTWQWKKQLA
ncbi:MAG: COX15/CtaA family protein [Pirellulaceae bacterium]|nr:COX15/CtaA family protein [Pirellulaceae bacterium]